jgi:hypothetical protein
MTGAARARSDDCDIARACVGILMAPVTPTT